MHILFFAGGWIIYNIVDPLLSLLSFILINTLGCIGAAIFYTGAVVLLEKLGVSLLWGCGLIFITIVIALLLLL